MRKIKTLIAFLLLIIISVGVVFAPRIINMHNHQKKLQKTAVSNLKIREEIKITSKQVCEFFYDAADDKYGSFAMTYSDNFDDNLQGNVNEEIDTVLNKVFANNQTIETSLEKLIFNGDMRVMREGILTVIDERPVVFDMVSVYSNNVNGEIEIIYEAKTQTLVRFSYFSVYPFDENNSVKYEEFENAIRNYYKKDCEMEHEIHIMYDFFEKTDFKNFYMFFDIRNPIKVEVEIDGKEEIIM